MSIPSPRAPDLTCVQTLGPSVNPFWDIYASRAPINTATDIVKLILSYLPLEDLGRSSVTCRQWAAGVYTLVEEGYDLSNLIRLSNVCNRPIPPEFRVIGPAGWERCGLPGIPKSVLDLRTAIPGILHLLKTLRVEGNAGGTLLTMPAGFTLNKLIEFMAAFRETHGEEGSAAKFRFITSSFIREFGDVPIRGGMAFITNALLEGSRNKTVEQQEALVKENGCVMPDVLTAATLAMVTYMVFHQRFLFEDNLTRIYTRCSNKTNDRRKVIIGGFAPAGLGVDFNVFDYDSIGVFALWKFLWPLVLGDLRLGNEH